MFTEHAVVTSATIRRLAPDDRLEADTGIRRRLVAPWPDAVPRVHPAAAVHGRRASTPSPRPGRTPPARTPGPGTSSCDPARPVRRTGRRGRAPDRRMSVDFDPVRLRAVATPARPARGRASSWSSSRSGPPWSSRGSRAGIGNAPIASADAGGVVRRGSAARGGGARPGPISARGGAHADLGRTWPRSSTPHDAWGVRAIVADERAAWPPLDGASGELCGPVVACGCHARRHRHRLSSTATSGRSWCSASPPRAPRRPR